MRRMTTFLLAILAAGCEERGRSGSADDLTPAELAIDLSGLWTGEGPEVEGIRVALGWTEPARVAGSWSEGGVTRGEALARVKPGMKVRIELVDPLGPRRILEGDLVDAGRGLVMIDPNKTRWSFKR